MAPIQAPESPPQLTARAAAAGMVLGGLLALSNVYVVLKTGWSLGVTLSACILAFAAFRVLAAARLTQRDLTPLENTMAGSVASAAAFMTGGGNMAALPALLVLTGARPGGFTMFVWFAALAALGVLAAIPLKRRIIDVEALPFPSSVATAETLRAMHAGKGQAESGKLLVLSALLAGAGTFLRDAPAFLARARLPAKLALPFALGGLPAARYSFAFEASPVLLGGGALMGLRTAWSMLLGAGVAYGLLAPRWVAAGLIPAVEYKAIVAVTLWPGAALLASSGVLALALQGGALRRASADLGATLRLRPAAAEDPDHAEARSSWFFAGVAVLAPVVVLILGRRFGVPSWAGLLTVPLSLLMAAVAARVNGETDISPTKALGPLTQLFFGLLLPGNVTANLMTANVTGGVGLHAGDLLADVKIGQLLGAAPRKQVIAQLLGVVVGAAVVVPAFSLLVSSAGELGTDRFPAPAVMVWAGVARALSGGLGGLAPAVRAASLAGAALGAALTLAERWAPPRLRRFLPSPTGLGIALVMPGSSSITLFAGALLGLAARRARPKLAGRALVPVASGMIVGESLVGVGMALARAAGWLA